jgi:hypothetical protein
MKQIILLLVVSLFTQAITTSAQDSDKKAAYFSANMSAYSSPQSNSPSRNEGGTRIGGGLGFGINLFHNVYLYGKATYVAKSNYIGIYDNNYYRTEVNISENLSMVNASMAQFVVNGGIQYNVILSKELTLGVLGGLTYTLVDQETRLFSGELVQRIDYQSFYGYFGGVSAEKSFKNSDFSMFAEAIYNYIDDKSAYFRNVFSGMNFTIGGRYYFVGQ